MRRNPAPALTLFLLACAFSPPASAQNVGPFGKNDELGTPLRVDVATRYETAPGTGVLVFHVFAEKSGARLNGRVQLLLTNLANDLGLAQTIPGDADGIFTNLTPGNYEITAGALGYLSVHQTAQVITTVHAAPIEIVLQRDPYTVSLEVTDNVISPRARKEARHAVSLLTAGDFGGAQKYLQQAHQLAPSSSDVNFLLGYLYFQEKNYTQAGTYLSTAATLSPNSSRALTLLGRTNLQTENYPAARSALEQAVLADPENWTPHDLLADAYLHQKDYGKARDEAQIAIAKGQALGKSTVAPSQVALGQALLGLGQKQEAIQAFNTFLKDSPQNPLVYQVRSLIAQLEKPSSIAANKNPNDSQIDASHADPLAAVPNASLSAIQAWRPPDVDDVRPALIPGVTCDTARVVAESGQKILELVQNLSRFAADEDLFHQSLDAFGFPIHTEVRKYDYTALVSPDHASPDHVSSDSGSVVSIEESRSDKFPAQAGYPDGIASTGFITLAFVFHPELQKDFDFECEGQADWQGKSAWVVHFRQRPDRPNRMHSYNIGQTVPVDLKGRAWITANNFQVVQIAADMVKPLPQIELLSERQTVEYGPVPFPTKNTTLWLPKKVEIYIDLRKHHYYRRHSFDHYMLFSVDTNEKDKAPENKEPPPESE
jgi:tetratricopeptide (TPR) repeat protein